jgi:NADPH-dependent glutamate synthase beta subunit-like oxidoreductase/ferredoxin
MVKIKINNKEFEAANGETILQIAQRNGIKIPTMCMADGLEHYNSCMICLVQDNKSKELIPSCSMKCEDGMDISTENNEIFESRKTALELMLSDHIGDCIAPCTLACTANMNIPLMNRLIKADKFDEAIKIVRNDIALPEVLGWICPAPCEKVCKRKDIDEAVSICLLKKSSAQIGNISAKKTDLISDKKVAVIGAGPSGLAAAFYLRTNGIQADIYDKNQKAGGNLRYAIEDEKLPKYVLDREVKFIEDAGVNFFMNSEINKSDFQDLISKYDAIIIATGDISEEIKSWNINYNKNGLDYNKSNYSTEIPKLFVAGNITRPFKMAIRSLGQGKEVAGSVFDFLISGNPKDIHRKFNSKFGSLMDVEISEYLKEATDIKRINPKSESERSFSKQEAIEEASRCLHCDCRKQDNCKLRDYSDAYNARQNKYFDKTNRKAVRKIIQHKFVIYEPEKCIKCAICVRITEKYKEKLGLGFIGRGFDIEVAVPFDEDLNVALQQTAEIVVESCPTAALSMR